METKTETIYAGNKAYIYNLYNIIILITTVGGEVIFLWNKIVCHTIYSDTCCAVGGFT